MRLSTLIEYTLLINRCEHLEQNYLVQNYQLKIKGSTIESTRNVHVHSYMSR